jgi:hypothetical protein
MKRHHQILASILAIQVVLAIVVLWPRPAATGGGDPVFPDLEAKDIVALTITDADDRSIALRQVGEEWVLPEADDYPSEAGKITPLLDNIVGLTTDRLVTRTAASHGRLQLSANDFVLRLDFETADGSKHTLYLGSSPRYGATHFRVEGQNEAYLTDTISTWDVGVEASNWIDTTYVSVPEEEVTKMTLENPNGPFVFTKDDQGEWRMLGMPGIETLDEVKVNGLIRKVASLSMTEPLGKEELEEYGMNEPQAVAMLETADTTVTLRVGAQDPEDSSYVVISSELPYYVRVSQFSVEDLVTRTREDFYKEEATPTPEEETATPTP